MSTTPWLPSAYDGYPADFGTIISHQRELTSSFGTMYGQFWSNGVVDHPTKEIVRLRNAQITECGY